MPEKSRHEPVPLGRGGADEWGGCSLQVLNRRHRAALPRLGKCPRMRAAGAAGTTTTAAAAVAAGLLPPRTCRYLCREGTVQHGSHIWPCFLRMKHRA